MSTNNIYNPFARYAYTPLAPSSETSPDALDNETSIRPKIFSGSDLQAFVNHQKVGNLESVTWSVSVEVVGNYVMGQRNATGYTKGKRVIVGSMVFSQYDRHAILEQVFKLSSLNITTLGDMWAFQGNQTAGSILRQENTVTLGSVAGLSGTNQPSYLTTVQKSSTTGGKLENEKMGVLSRGIDSATLNRRLQEELQYVAEATARQRIENSDQIPPFDLTLVGVNGNGDAARCALFGVQITQETAGFSANDMGNAVGISFVALRVSPWRPVLVSGDNAVSTQRLD